MRDVLFLSHANPEDNEVTLWFALQLTQNGYPVWCDLLNVIAGQDFWKEAEAALRNGTEKVLFVLSKTSNQKPGPLKEISVAQKIERKDQKRDFVIGLRVDDLPFDDINIELTRNKVINCYPSRAEGFKELLETLQKYGIKPDPQFTPNLVSSWWKEYVGSLGGIKQSVDEKYVSNFYPVIRPLPKIHLYTITDDSSLPQEAVTPFPIVRRGQILVSFMGSFKGADIWTEAQPSHQFSEDFDKFCSDNSECELFEQKQQRRNFATQLLRLSWENLIEKQKVPYIGLSSTAKAIYFTQSILNKDRLPAKGKFTGSRVSMVGYKSLYRGKGKPKKIRFWHFALRAKPTLFPEVGFVVKPQIFFSDDGEAIWSDVRKMHKARRSQAMNWWNDFWRDHIQAPMAWLAEGNTSIDISVAEGAQLFISSKPSAASSTAGYEDGFANQLEQEFDEDNEEEDSE